ncbi:MAG: cytochrome c maturation protein CcmE [Alphaproteobacteria bacterium]|nr:cytochrome c maturation protein CcmE [Alphaproteobacteria bacterium]
MKQRSWYLLALILLVGGISLMVLGALKENVVFFITPTEWQEKRQFFVKTKTLRLGGRVAQGSIVKENDKVIFEITDEKTSLKVMCKGTLPDLFKEGQGIVTEGSFDDQGVFIARQVLAKHDENYMPKEVADKLKEQALWRGK